MAEDLTTPVVHQEEPKGRSKVIWAIVWFVALIVCRILTVPVADGLGLDESTRYLLVRPVSFVSDFVMLAVAFIASMRFLFPNTLAKDAGTRFNTAFANINDPFKLLIVYAIFLGPLLLVLGLLMLNS